jgi:putative ABC transport system ATP-binding protein
MPAQPSRRGRRPVVKVDQLTKVYGEGEAMVKALWRVSLTIERGEHVAIMGASGSGKSTLMQIIGCLDAPTSGTYLLDGVDVRGLDDDQLAEIRGTRIGFVFQSFNLVPRTTALAQAWRAASITCRRSCPVVSSNGWHWRAPSSRTPR